MARADFYTLKDSHGDARYRLLQQLLSKSLGQGTAVHIHCRDAAEVSHLDDYIWGFKPESFLPHHVLDDSHMQSPITLGHGQQRPAKADICINLSAEPVKDYERIIEIVVQEPSILQQTRAHYRHYQQAGHEMNLHKL